MATNNNVIVLDEQVLQQLRLRQTIIDELRTQIAKAQFQLDVMGREMQHFLKDAAGIDSFAEDWSVDVAKGIATRQQPAPQADEQAGQADQAAA